jgi:hypothetical protein
MVTELVSFQRVIASGSTAAETVERLLLGICVDAVSSAIRSVCLEPASR